MSTSQCFGIKIILQDKDNPVTEDESFGLYNVTNDNSEFKWSQNDILEISDWKAGMIIENGIEPFSVEIDLRIGGNISYPGNGSVTVKNNDMFHKFLKDNNIKISGLKLEIYLLYHNDFDNQEILYRTYKCLEPNYNSKKFTIPFKGMQDNRKSNILNIVSTAQFPDASKNTINKTIPAVFGKMYPLFDTTRNISASFNVPAIRSTIAKGIRISDQEIDSTYNNSVFDINGLFPDIKEFPVVYDASIGEKSGTLEVIFECKGNANTTLLLFPEDTYVFVTSGIGKGQFRKCFFIQQTSGGTNPNIFTALIEDYLETDLEDQRGTNQSWIKFIVLKRDYYFDHFPCKSFIDENGNDITQNPKIFTIEDNAIEQAMDFGYESKNVSTNNNIVEIKPLLCTNDINTINSVIIKPVIEAYALITADLSAWNKSGESWGEDYELTTVGSGYGYGLYHHHDYGSPASISGYPTTFSMINDRLSNTWLDYNLDIVWGVNEPRELLRCIGFTLPSQPIADWNDLYIGIKMTIDTNDQEVMPSWLSHFKIMLRKWKYGVTAVDGLNIQTANSCYVGNVPDFYFTNEPVNLNYDFFHEMETETWQDSFTGYKIFKIPDIDRTNYGSFVEGLIVNCMEKGLSGDADLTHNLFRLYELAFIFKKGNQDISQAILTPIKGRIFDSSFTGRKTPTDLIEKPIDLFEHVCRLQDYRDTCSIPTVGWGLHYAIEPLIATSGFGSFDDVSLLNARNYYTACQLLYYDDGYTDKLKQKICSDFDLANWQDASGNERVIALPNNKFAPVHTITLDDILDRNKIEVKPLTEDMIFAEPFVKFNKNAANGEYDDMMYIKNTSASVYNTSYVSGIQNENDAFDLWNSCHSLALLCHKVNKPPVEMTELTFANGDGAYTIAFNHLRNWINWQFGEEIFFETHFNIAGSWQECTPFNVLFSHQTNNISRSALVEQSTVNPNHPYDVMIKAIMYA